MSIDGPAIEARYAQALLAAQASALLGGWNTERAGILYQSWRDMPMMVDYIQALEKEILNYVMKDSQNLIVELENELKKGL